MLQNEYGVTSHAIMPALGGFSTKAAYHVTDADGAAYFCKVYDPSRPTTRFFIERIDRYMPALDCLSALPALHGRILQPIPARSGGFKTETDGDVYVLFLFVPGETPGIQGMTRAQTAELAEILALLHESSSSILFEAPGLAEDTSLPFCAQLKSFLHNADVKRGLLSDILSSHTDALFWAIDKTLRLRDTVRLGYAPLVLCHGDAHGNNVIQGERLVLADWEDLRWAPAEADLFIHAWHPHGDTLLEAYAAARRGYRINSELLGFYTLRRRIEDMWADIQRLTEESPDEAETSRLLGYVRQSINESINEVEAEVQALQ